MSEHEHKEVVRRYLQAFNDRDRDTLREVLADDVVEHGVHETLRGPEEIIEYLDVHFETFPDYSGEAGHVIAEGGVVAVQYAVEGTHTGEYRDLDPTGHTVEWSGIAMYRIEDGEIAEIWIEEDRLGLYEQLEVVDRPAHLRI